MLRRALLATAIAAATLPATATAATLDDAGGQLEYQAAAGDLISFQVYGTASATYFGPTLLHPTTSTGCTVLTAGSGSSSCPRRARVRLRLAERDDFVGVQSPADVVELRMGEGSDRMWTLGTRVEAYGQGGDDDLSGGPAIDLLDGGPGNDLLTPSSFADTISGGPDVDMVRYGGAETVVVTLDDIANDGRRASGSRVADNQNIKSDVEGITGGDGPDELDGNGLANTLRGGDGGDLLNPGAGADTVLGEAGEDTINVKDGAADTVNCGAGTDAVVADVADVLTSCETVTLPDDDADGVRRPFDCDDANPAVKPGAVDVAGDGVDQDCSGADLPAPVIEPPPGPVTPVTPVTPVPAARVQARIQTRWALGRTRTKVVQLDVKDVPAGGSVEIRCAGQRCPFARRAPASTRFGPLFRGRALKPGTVIEVRVTSEGMIGKVVRYTMRSRRRLPVTTTLCLPPGAGRPGPC